MRKISVGDVMTRNVVTALPDASLHDCAKIMVKHDVNSLLIVSGKRLVGILTSGDILRAITKNPNIDLKKLKSYSFASKKIAVIKPSSDISQAVEKMKYLNFRRLPVISNGELLGVVTLKDILSVEPGLYAETNHLMDAIREFDVKLRQTEKQWPLEGLCENCGAFSELLRVQGQLLCADCRDELY